MRKKVFFPKKDKICWFSIGIKRYYINIIFSWLPKKHKQKKGNSAVVHSAMVCDHTCFMLVWRFHQLISGFLAKGRLPRVSRKSRLMTNVKDLNEVKRETVHRSPGMYLMSEENPGKLNFEDHLITVV